MKAAEKSPPGKSSHADETSSAPAAADGARKLTEDEVAACATRLSKPFQRTFELPPLLPRQVITKDTCDKSVARLYTESIEKKRKWAEKAATQKATELLKPVICAPEVLEGCVDRLYIQSLELRKRNATALDEKYYKGEQEPKRKLKKDEQFESSKRLCDGSVEKAREVQRALFEKYVTGTAPKYVKRSKEQMLAAIEKLTAKPG